MVIVEKILFVWSWLNFFFFLRGGGGGWKGKFYEGLLLFLEGSKQPLTSPAPYLECRLSCKLMLNIYLWLFRRWVNFRFRNRLLLVEINQRIRPKQGRQNLKIARTKNYGLKHGQSALKGKCAHKMDEELERKLEDIRKSRNLHENIYKISCY